MNWILNNTNDNEAVDTLSIPLKEYQQLRYHLDFK